ncbi:MAG: agmatinase [Proteobacteria bacterium]|nr:agmatinase [Pseudomonadota bacterium]
MINNYFYPLNFAGLGKEYSDYKSSFFTIIPVPFDSSTSYSPGARKGPLAIIDSSIQLEWFDDELELENYKLGIHTFNFLDTKIHPEKTVEILEKVVGKVLKDGKFPIVIGGDHSLSYAPIKSLKEKIGNFTVIHFDAHSDLRDEYQGSKHSHACTARRILDLDIPVVQIGIRSLTREDYNFIKSNPSKIKTFFAREIYNSTKDYPLIEKAIKTDNIYITFDVDVFDPSIIPSTGTPEPGGLGWYQVLEILKMLVNKRNLIGFDVVELAPNTSGPSEFIIAKLIYKLIGYITFKKEKKGEKIIKKEHKH